MFEKNSKFFYNYLQFLANCQIAILLALALGASYNGSMPASGAGGPGSNPGTPKYKRKANSLNYKQIPNPKIKIPNKL